MIRNKYIIAPMLFLAWTIIFAHNIVPHHHHLAETSARENHCHHESHDEHTNQEAPVVTSQFDCCDHENNDHTCHFHVEVLTQVSIDNIFITHIENSLFSDITCLEKKLISYYQEFIPEQIPQKYYLRGPPQFHNS